MKTKKMPVSVSYGDFKSKSDEFLIPFANEASGFLGLSSGNSSTYGMVTYIGIEIDENEIFKRLVDSRRKINNVDKMVNRIVEFIEQLQQFKVGNIISIDYLDGEDKFTLVKEANKLTRISKKRMKLP